ncbi:LacI family DNA-binding transcriptional regulator [Puniceicoccus vermicola]|uniref:LacI family DNA-binding transcriptional regulator n=1 Tax=Puniceicoccus vermicola TaxID=388746 RepID=A0A7X1E4P7_9BACT|nr:LacI family DNA-binding transcriptional regulator [Puniceicoccus vermicola]MBC2602750.1 LacI family DNA-binding transcriptional regulator [Puniceicoccus vermicola]
MGNPSLKDIAKVAGVSEMTVSRALRAHPEVSERTRRRVLAIAEELGYRPDPQIARMMAYLRSSREHRTQENLAYLWLDATEREVRANPHAQRILGGVKVRAEMRGYGVEEFYLEEEGLSMDRLSTILHTRGINGVLISPLHHHLEFDLDLRWECFSTVVIGGGQVGPPLHRTGPDHFQGMSCAISNLRQLGYRRIALCLGGGSFRRQDRRWEGSFLLHHPLGVREAESLMLVEENLAESEVEAWLQKCQPEVVLFQGGEIDSFLEARSEKVQPFIPYATLDWLPEMEEKGIAGLDQQNERAGMNAVDLVTADLLRNERGVPSHPKTVLHEGLWVRGGF